MIAITARHSMQIMQIYRALVQYIYIYIYIYIKSVVAGALLNSTRVAPKMNSTQFTRSFSNSTRIFDIKNSTRFTGLFLNSTRNVDKNNSTRFSGLFFMFYADCRQTGLYAVSI